MYFQGCIAGRKNLVNNRHSGTQQTTHHGAPRGLSAQYNHAEARPYSNTWIFPISLFTVICLQLSRQFKELNKTIAKATEKDGTITKCLEMIRREHQHLCRSVGHADHIFSVIVLVELGLNLPLICFLLYEIIVVSYPFGAFMLTLIVFWLLAICTSVGIVSWFGAVLHESAHAAVHNLHDISISPGTENHRILEVCMFMAKMNGTPIAITICNLIPLTKEFILTLLLRRAVPCRQQREPSAPCRHHQELYTLSPPAGTLHPVANTGNSTPCRHHRELCILTPTPGTLHPVATTGNSAS
uniref:Uncharacterized protein LOC100367002 n=1 Tax=Saccoglossus kowalevskii TaxID=10224 RepID=A0ABM0LX93_SACKO|nr:PREDICTED: uncharacterized protein LOC100367002 [Saccoglossus kowalevskii]